MASSSVKLRKCERCGKYKRRLYNIDGMQICADCIRGIAFYRVFKEGFRDPRLRGDVVTAGIDVGNLVWLNPFAQAWLYPLSLWIFFKTRGLPFYFDDLKSTWRYKTPLDTVLKVYVEEGIFRVVEVNGKKVIVEGDALADMFKKYSDRSDVYDIVSAWVSGLVTSRIHEEADAPDFRAVNSIVQVIADKLIDANGDIRAEPYSKPTGYRCRLCHARFATKEEIRRHLMIAHRAPSDEVMTHVEEESVIVGYLLDYEHLINELKKEGVKPEKFVERMQKFAILVHEDPEVPWIIDRDGKKYVVVHPAWVRVVARARIYERELMRARERVQ